ncbi:MAG TPA: hypothetical protein VGG76_01665 [Gemmatimonadaceae bacterium]
MVILLATAPGLLTAQSSVRDGTSAKGADAAPVGPLPSWLSVGGQLRVRAESYSGGGFKADNSDSYLLTRAFLNARVRPTS